jgi:hypothetical protein
MNPAEQGLTERLRWLPLQSSHLDQGHDAWALDASLCFFVLFWDSTARHRTRVAWLARYIRLAQAPFLFFSSLLIPSYRSCSLSSLDSVPGLHLVSSVVGRCFSLSGARFRYAVVAGCPLWGADSLALGRAKCSTRDEQTPAAVWMLQQTNRTLIVDIDRILASLSRRALTGRAQWTARSLRKVRRLIFTREFFFSASPLCRDACSPWVLYHG